MSRRAAAGRPGPGLASYPIVVLHLSGLPSSMALARVSAWRASFGADINSTSQNDWLGTDTGVPCKRVRSAETKDGIMAEPSTERTSRHAFEKVLGRAQAIRGWAEQTLLWKIWDRMLETEFIDRGIALALVSWLS